MTKDELTREVFVALGAASMCWNPLPSNQVFDAELATTVGNNLVDTIWRGLGDDAI